MQIALNSAAAGMQISADCFASAGTAMVHETTVGIQGITSDPVPMRRMGNSDFTDLQEANISIEAAAVAMAAAHRAYGASMAVMKASAEMEATLLNIAGSEPDSKGYVRAKRRIPSWMAASVTKVVDPAPGRPSFMSRVCSPFAPMRGGLQRLLG